MKLRRYLRPEMIRLRMNTRMPEPDPEIPPERVRREVKEAVIGELAGLLASSGRTGKETKLVLDLWNREKKAATAIGGGIAIPHVRTIQAKELVMAVALSPEGIDFDAPDREPVRVFVSIVAPPYDDSLYLKIVKHLTTITTEQPDLVDRLLGSESAQDVIWHLGGDGG